MDMSRIVADSFMVNVVSNPDEITYEEIQELLPRVKNFDLLVRFYENMRNFTNEELLELSEYLQYIGSKRVMEILIVMKLREFKTPNLNFAKFINTNLVSDYNYIKISHSPKNNQKLLLAIFHDLDNMVNYLIDYDSPTEFELICASKSGSYKVAKLLLENGANIHANEDESLKLACENDHLKLAELLLKNGADVHTHEDLALKTACKSGNIEMVKLLLENGANVNSERLPLFAACENGHIEIVKLLINHGAKITKDLEISISCENGYTEIVKILIENGSIIDHESYDIIYEVNNYGYTEIVELLLTNYSYNFQDEKEVYEYESMLSHLLFEASEYHNYDIVKLLLEKGAKDEESNAMFAVCKNGNIEIVKLLSQYNTDDNINYHMLYAIENNHFDIVKLFLENGAKDNEGDSLNKASEQGNIEIVKLLLQYNIYTYSGFSHAIYSAKENGHNEIVKILKEYMKTNNILPRR